MDKELGNLRAEFKALTGKSPSPRLDSAALRVKIEEAKTAAAATAEAEKAAAAAAASPPPPPPPPPPPASDDANGDDGDSEEVAALKAELEELKAKLAASPEAPAEPGPAATDAPQGTALLDHDDPDAGASFGGVELVRGKDGFFLVPLAAVDALAGHGFRLVGEGE